MAETLKKFIECECKCFLRDTLTQSSAGRVKIFGKNAVDLPCLIETALCENISKYLNSRFELLICHSKCFKRLEKAKKSLESIKEEICGIYQSINRKEKRQRANQVVV